MEDKTFYTILIEIVVVVILLAAIYIRTNYKRPRDYRALFIVGTAWIAIGLVADSYIYGIVVILFMFIGYRNRNKWEENRFRWPKLSSVEKKIKILVLSIIATASLLEVFRFYL